jgi:hypothetical protein
MKEAFMKRFTLAIAMFGIAAAGCLEEHDLDIETAEPAPIIGGIPDTGHLNVPMLQTSVGLCTGTLVSDHVVLTAAHCVEGATTGGVSFGEGLDDPTAESIGISGIMWHRYYDADTIGAGLPYDIALVRLKDPAPAGIDPMAMNLEPLAESLVGGTMLAVGFGADDGPAQTGFGLKRRVLLPINSIGAMLIGMGDDTVNTCQGDSGGPGIVEFDGVEHVIGITSTGPQGCVGNSHQTRLDIYSDSFVIPIVDAWSGPCQFDGDCVTEGCRTPDPDCEPCGVDTFCSSGCPTLDLDCPVVGFPGDLCKKNDDCESRLCIEASDDPRVKYCSTLCDPSNPLEDECDPPLGECAASSEDGEACQFKGPSRSAQGYDCTSGAECRSGVCDPDHGICIEQCGDGLPECGDEYSCESVGDGVKACTFPSGGCGCAAGGRRNGSDSGGLLLMLGVAILTFCRRPHARHS